MRDVNPINIPFKSSTVLLIACFIIALIVFMNCFNVVPVGHRGLFVRFGVVTSEPLEEGVYFKIPFITQLVTMNVKVQKWEDKTNAYSKDAQVVEVISSLNYALKKDQVKNIFQNVGKDFERILIPQVFQGLMKEVIGQYNAVDLVSQRDEGTQRIKEKLTAKLDELGIVVTNYEVNNLNFDDSFERAVKDKVIAVERAKEAKNKTIQIEEEAKQKIITAKAEAEAMKIRAIALSQNKNLVEYEAVKKWNGVLPHYTGGQIPFINVKSK